MRRLITVLMCFVVPVSSFAGLPNNWQEIMQDKKILKAPSMEKMIRSSPAATRSRIFASVYGIPFVVNWTSGIPFAFA